MKRITLGKRGRIKESESSIQARIVDLLRAHGWLLMENRSGKMNALASRMTGGKAAEKGTPDLFVWGSGGKHFCIETKRPGGKMSAEQIAWCGEFCKRGFLYITATSEVGVEKALRERGWWA